MTFGGAHPPARADTVHGMLDALAVEHAQPSAAAAWAWVRAEVGEASLECIRWVHVERHWWPRHPAADVIVALEPQARAGTPAPALLRHVAASRAASIVSQWHQARAAGAAVGRCWLEFDAPAASALVTAPGCFIDARHSTQDRADDALARFAGVVEAGVRLRAIGVWQAVRAAVPAASLASVGWMGRGGAPMVRLCLAGPVAEMLPACTDADAADAIRRQLARCVVGVPQAQPAVHMLHLDVSIDGVAAIGIELACNKRTQLHRVLVETPLLDALVHEGWCSDADAVDARTFAGAVRIPATAHDVAVRRLSHVKLVFRGDALSAVKGYFAVGALSRRVTTPRIVPDHSIR